MNGLIFLDKYYVPREIMDMFFANCNNSQLMKLRIVCHLWKRIIDSLPWLAENNVGCDYYTNNYKMDGCIWSLIYDNEFYINYFKHNWCYHESELPCFAIENFNLYTKNKPAWWLHYANLPIESKKTKRLGFLKKIDEDCISIYSPGGYNRYWIFENEYYAGEFKNDKYDGYGILKKMRCCPHSSDVDYNYIYMYEGGFKNDEKTGYGQEYVYVHKGFKSKIKYISKYTGYFKNDVFDGQGILSYIDGYRYEGQFKRGLYHGYGHLIYPNGDIYDGYFTMGRYDYGTLKTSKGDIYKGPCKKNISWKGFYEWTRSSVNDTS